MSYILDALKKSERERALGNIPSLKTTVQPERKGVPLSWFVGLLVALVAFVAWSVWSNIPEPAPTVERQAAKSVGAIQPSEGNVAQTARQPSADNVSEQEGAVNVEQPETSAVVITDLDPATRSRLPDLAINALSYSETKSKRFVMINQNIYKEGESIGGGVVVEEILGSRVILRQEDIRFALLP